VVEFAGVRQVIVPTRKLIVGVAVETGALLWQIPYPSMVGPNAVTPVVYKQKLVYSGESRGTTAVKVVKRGQGWGTEVVWHNTDVAMYMNSPVVGGEFVFGLSHKNRGQFFCLDAHTGKTLWASAGRTGENAAILKAGDALLLLTDDGRLTVARMTHRGYEPLKHYQVADSATWAHPAIIKNRILIKDVEHLAL
jgi:outer membrane protein assembly factor BamB